LIFYLISDIIKVERKGVGFMIFKNLLTSVTKEEMVEYFSNIENEKEYIDKYCELYDNLLKKEPEDSGLKLFLVWQKDYFDDYGLYISVLGLDIEDGEYYALDLTSRSRWLGSEVLEKSLNDFGRVTFVCECLLAMTEISFDEERVEEEKQILADRIKEIEEGTAKFISGEDVFENIREKYGWEVHEVTIDETEERYSRVNEIKDFNNVKINEMLGRC
jgi:hypothetical protein